MEDLITLVNELNERGVSFHSLEENITMDKSSSTGQLLFHLFAAFAEFERNLILDVLQLAELQHVLEADMEADQKN